MLSKKVILRLMKKLKVDGTSFAPNFFVRLNKKAIIIKRQNINLESFIGLYAGENPELSYLGPDPNNELKKEEDKKFYWENFTKILLS